MTRSAREQAVIEEFAKTYGQKKTDVWQQMECCIFGCDYGATSWTTRAEADALAGTLALGPGKTFLEVGAGAGWPGIYIAGQTGSTAVLIDLPFEGAQIALRRIHDDGLAGRCAVAVGDGAALPLPDGSFDAVFHSDVLCCMQAKREMLQECRRVLLPEGRLTFLVLSVVPGLSAAQQEKAQAWGPPFIAAECGYAAMLEQTGWEITSYTDVTPAYYATIEIMKREEQAHADQLIALHGDEGFKQRLAGSEARLAAVDQGLIVREQFTALPALDSHKTNR